MKKKYTQDQLVEIQCRLEMDMKATGIERFGATNQRAIDQGEASGTLWNRRIVSELVEPTALIIDAYLEEYKGRRGKPSKTLTYLRLLDSKVAAYVTLKVVLDHLAQQSSLLKICLAVGSRIEDQVRFSRLHNEAPRYIDAVKRSLSQSKTQSYRHQHVKMGVAEKSLTEEGVVSRWVEWPKADKVQLGSRLLEWMSQGVLFEGEPLFNIELHTRAKSKENVVVPSTNLQDWINRFKDEVGEMSPAYAPCVIQPKDWTSPYNGGYHVPDISATLPLVKANRKHAKRLTVDQMPAVYESVNALQAVKWQINDDILSVASAVQELGVGTGMPQAEPYESEPFPFDTELRGKELRESLTPNQCAKLSTWKAKRIATLTQERKRKASILEYSRAIAQAKAYQPFDSIHYVYTLDFRGRIYAQGSAVTPQGGDIGKALLRFSEGVELGKDGEFWLAVHGANVWGEDKVQFSDRVKWVHDHLDEILDSAADPISYTWWTGADKPWQFLAFCKEWERLEEHGESLIRETFISHLPVAMDGSCSGIQHYSAMLRDAVGGAAVNLVPDSYPHDIYGDVAGVARDTLADAVARANRSSDPDEIAAGVYAQKALAVSPEGKHLVDRNCCKRPVMTLPYGSTRITCMQSISEYMADKGSWSGLQSDSDFTLFLTPVVWDSIGKVVKAARDGMAFIRAVARGAGKANSHMEWVAPSGFLVEQARFKTEERKVDTQLMGRTVISLREDTKEIDSRAMQSSAAPNFVHSMDASHLTLATVAYKRAGINSIAVIHDSFGAHAGRTTEARKLLINSFVDMYLEHDVLEELMYSVEAVIGKDLELELPEMGNLDLEEVRNSEYGFA